MKKTIITILLGVTMSLTSIVSNGAVFANENIVNYENIYEDNSSTITPFDMDVSSGSISSSTGFDNTWKLDSKNGKHVNFYIENTGNVNIKATINGNSERIFKPGDSGHISVEVSNGILGAKEYRFKAVSESNGGTVKMDYIIAQRD